MKSSVVEWDIAQRGHIGVGPRQQRDRSRCRPSSATFPTAALGAVSQLHRSPSLFFSSSSPDNLNASQPCQGSSAHPMRTLLRLSRCLDAHQSRRCARADDLTSPHLTAISPLLVRFVSYCSPCWYPLAYGGRHWLLSPGHVRVMITNARQSLDGTRLPADTDT